MFPGSYEFRWAFDHLIFLGAFFGVLTTIGLVMFLALGKSIWDFRKRKVAAIQWQEDFHDLPAARCACRHTLTGRAAERECHAGFDCRTCAFHAQMTELPAQETADESELRPLGFDMPLTRRYHRGHTWVEPQDDGTLLVGLDDFGRRLLGSIERAELPPVGTHLEVNGPAWRMIKGSQAVRMLSPVAGTILATGMLRGDWLLRIKPDPSSGLGHLLQGGELRAWMAAELERLQNLLAEPGLGVSLTDGGSPVEDFTAGYPEADWDLIRAEMFLLP